MSALPPKADIGLSREMSALCQKRTHAVQQFTSAAKHWAAVGRAGMWPNGKVNHFMKSSERDAR